MGTSKEEPLRGLDTTARIERAADLLCERDRLVKELALAIAEIDNQLEVILGDDIPHRKPRCRNSDPLSKVVLRVMYRSTLKKLNATDIADEVRSVGYTTNSKDFDNSIHCTMVGLAHDGIVESIDDDVSSWSLTQSGEQRVRSTSTDQ